MFGGYAIRKNGLAFALILKMKLVSKLMKLIKLIIKNAKQAIHLR
jgi:hypothetical protein